MAFTYTGHYPPGGIWTRPTTERLPIYLLDQQLSPEEIKDRNRKCTFNTILQGAGLLTDTYLDGREVLAFGHSTGGPMAAHLTRFTRNTTIIGLVGFGTGGPDGWRKEWRETTGAETYTEYPMDDIRYETADRFLGSGYEDPPDLTPWGGAPEYLAWSDRVTSQMKTGLCNNQHRASVGILEEYAKKTGLPRREYLDHLEDPDPKWLKTIRVLLLVGENDKGHWVKGQHLEDKREMFMAKKYAAATLGAHVVVIPRYGHCAYVALHNEKFVYLWLWALKSGYFD
jgi:pimeloyl-ACP methyl ester carboxylesterase